MEGLVYKAVAPSGKVYIGVTTTSLKLRLKEHRKAANKRRHGAAGYYHNNKFYKALRFYGDEMRWEILYDNVPIHKLYELEKEEIRKHNSYLTGYNSTLGGESSPMLNPEIAAKVAASLTGRKLSPEHADLCRKSWLPGGPCNWKGRKRDENFKEALRQARLKDNPAKRNEVRKKMSDSAKLRWSRNNG